MACGTCGDKPKKCNKDFTKAVIEIDNPEQTTLMRKVTIPASMGDDTTVPPAVGKYHNVLLYYEANSKTYLYSSDGIPTQLVNGVTDYEAAVNLPQINGHTLLGNKTGDQLGLQNKLTAGENVSIDSDNVISAVDTTYGPATDTEIGLVKPGDGLEVNANGTMSVSDIEQYAHFFDTVADMKAATNLVAGDYARTLGFHTINDGGGAIYKISNTGTANEMDVIAVGSLYAHLIVEEELTPEQFGAYGDGTHDDAPSIRGALSYIATKNGGVLQLNEKVYSIGSVANPDETITTFFVIPNNLTMCGKGTLKVADDFGDYDCIFRYVEALDKMVIKDFTIDDNTANNPVLDTTGTGEGHHRTGFRLISYPTKEINIDNITFNDCIGVWQIIIERAIEAEISNVIINYNGAATLNYDRTSIYFGALYGNVYGCKLFGNGNGNTAFELHGNDNSLYNNYVNGYNSGAFVTNENIVNEDIDRLEVYSNTFDTIRRGVQCWITNDDRRIRLISIHDNLVNINSTTLTNTMGIGNHSLIGDGSVVEDYIIENNTITTNNTNAVPLIFTYAQATNSSTINNLIIKNNEVSGVMKYAVQLESQSDNTFNVRNTVINNNKFNISGADRVVHFVAKSGFDYLYFTSNIIKSNSIIYLYRIFGTPTCQTIIDGNKCDTAISAFYVASGDDVTGVSVKYENVLLNTGTVFNALPTNVLDGSIIKTDKYTCIKSDGKWVVNCVAEVMPQHQWFGKGSVINLTNDTNIMAIAKKDGYIADHDTTTGDHKVGDWVLYTNTSEVWYCKADNNYTDNPANHADSFQYIGSEVTFYTVSAS